MSLGLRSGGSLRKNGREREERPEDNDMKKYLCDVCGYVYDPENGDPDNGIPPGTPFDELPADWVCPMCFVGKNMFSPAE